jgi:calcyphosin
MIHPGYVSHNEKEMMHKSQRLLESQTLEDPVVVLRNLCLTRGFSGFLSFGRIFREMDGNGKTVLNLKQFTKGLKQTGLEMPDGYAEEIFRRFDMDGSGGINISELLAHIRVKFELLS